MAISIQRDLSLDSTGWRKMIDAVRQLINGRQNSIGDVTLNVSATSTSVTFENCSMNCRVFLFPQTAHAAAIVASVYIAKANIHQGSFVITHPSIAQADLGFSFLCIGG